MARFIRTRLLSDTVSTIARSQYAYDPANTRCQTVSFPNAHNCTITLLRKPEADGAASLPSNGVSKLVSR